MALNEVTIDSVRRKLLSDEWALILRENGTERYLPIYMGPYQADIIKRELISPKAEYFDLCLETLGAAAGIDIRSARLESVVINRFEDNVFHAKLIVTFQNNRQEVKCALPQAVAIAIRTHAPIFVDGQVLEQAAFIAGA